MSVMYGPCHFIFTDVSDLQCSSHLVLLSVTIGICPEQALLLTGSSILLVVSFGATGLSMVFHMLQISICINEVPPYWDFFCFHLFNFRFFLMNCVLLLGRRLPPEQCNIFIQVCFTIVLLLQIMILLISSPGW